MTWRAESLGKMVHLMSWLEPREAYCYFLSSNLGLFDIFSQPTWGMRKGLKWLPWCWQHLTADFEGQNMYSRKSTALFALRQCTAASHYMLLPDLWVVGFYKAPFFQNLPLYQVISIGTAYNEREVYMSGGRPQSILRDCGVCVVIPVSSH